MSTQQLPPPIKQLTTEEFRRQLAGLVDQRELLSPAWSDEQKQYAIRFVAALPTLYGNELDRLSMWDRIGTALQVAYAKTVGADHEYFISRVLEHVMASPASAARSDSLQFVMSYLAECPVAARQAWIDYMHTHLYAVLVHAKAEWEQVKQQRKEEKEGEKDGLFA